MFVDPTGQRRRRVAGLGALAALPALVFAGTLGFSALNGPPVDRLSLPTEQHQAQAAHRPAAVAAVIGTEAPDSPEHRAGTDVDLVRTGRP